MVVLEERRPEHWSDTVTPDIVQLSDEITVKCLGVDEKGRVRLSRKAALEERDQQENGGTAPAAPAPEAAPAPAPAPEPGQN